MIDQTATRNRRTSALRRGRISIPHARYFVTCAAIRPTNGLTKASVPETIMQSLAGLAHDRDVIVHLVTVLPDHIHALLTLGERLTLSQIIRKLKAQTRKALAGAGTAWQANFYDHRIRPDEDMNEYARYIFMNPYRAGLVDRMREWPHTHISESVDCDFQAMLEQGKYPPKAWLHCSENVEIGTDS